MADPKRTGNSPANPLYLRQHGERLVDHGYIIHPVGFRQKGIFDDNWQRVRATKQTVDKWLSNGHAKSGVSILTCKTPAIDVDCTDEALVQEAVTVIENCLFEFGGFPVVRQGRAPKLAIVCRTDEPFKKLKTHVFEDADGQKHHVEILGEGQQLVAYNIHPDTNKPYQYLTQDLAETPVSQLPLLDAETAAQIIEQINERFLELGLTIAKRNSTGVVDERYDGDRDAQFLDNLTEAGKALRVPLVDVETALDRLSGSGFVDDYDSWVQVGMGLYHWGEGTDQLDTASDLWDEWSQSSGKYDADAVARHWPSFATELARRPVTVLTLLKWSKEQKQRDDAQLLTDSMAQIEQAKDVMELRTGVAKAIREAAGHFKQVERDSISSAYQKRLKQLGIQAKISSVRAELFPAGVVVEGVADILTQNHSWVKGWFWSSERDVYHHIRIGAATEKTFRKRYMAGLMREFRSGLCDKKDYGLGSDDGSLVQVYGDPVKLCDTFGLIPMVRSVVYAPGHPELLQDQRAPEVTDLNSFRPWYAEDGTGTDRVDTDQSKWTKKQRKAVERFLKLFSINAGGEGHEKEAALLLAFFAYRIQNPHKRVQWAPFLYGPKGCGKSTIKDYITRLYGLLHVTEISPEELESQFSAWAARALFAFIDEIHTEGRAAREHVATRIRSHITGETVVRICKGRDGVQVPNYQSYIFISNDPNGLPMDEGERRYLVLESEFKTREEARAAMIDSGYREQLGLDMDDEDCLAAVRGFLQTMEIPEFFNPAAPMDTEAKAKSVEAGKSSITVLIEGFIEDESIWWANKEWICMTNLMRHVSEGVVSGLYPELGGQKFSAQYYGKVLSIEPLVYSNSCRIRIDNDRPTFRTQRPWTADDLLVAYKAAREAAVDSGTEDDWG